MSSNRSAQATLILDDGTKYKGKLFGASECVAGEVGKLHHEGDYGYMGRK